MRIPVRCFLWVEAACCSRFRRLQNLRAWLAPRGLGAYTIRT
jgi:hypothetical protein